MEAKRRYEPNDPHAAAFFQAVAGVISPKRELTMSDALELFEYQTFRQWDRVGHVAHDADGNVDRERPVACEPGAERLPPPRGAS